MTWCWCWWWGWGLNPCKAFSKCSGNAVNTCTYRIAYTLDGLSENTCRKAAKPQVQQKVLCKFYRVLLIRLRPCPHICGYFDQQNTHICFGNKIVLVSAFLVRLFLCVWIQKKLLSHCTEDERHPDGSAKQTAFVIFIFPSCNICKLLNFIASPHTTLPCASSSLLLSYFQ